MRRRHFLTQLSSGALLLGANTLPLSALSAYKNDFVNLTILHTNDVHSRIDPFPVDGSANQGLGGVPARMQLIKKVRAAEKNVLLLDAGDIFQGTPYFNLYNGELEMKLMSQMGYDASTVGNHDFDAGMENLAKQLQFASFPLLNVNYDFSNTPMRGHTQPYEIFVKDGVRIGVFGIGIALKSLVADALAGDTVYLDPLENANKTALHLKHEEKCAYVICLSHLGYKYDRAGENDKISDVKFAEASRNIDLIIGGHTHTFLKQPDIRKNMDGQPVIINQVGWAGILLGRIDVVFERGKSNRCETCKNILVQ